MLEDIKKLDGIEILENESIKNHCSMKVGGRVEILCIPESVESLIKLIDLLKSKNKEYLVIGRGSNLIFADKNIKKVIIKLTKACDFLEIDNNIVRVGAGYSLQKLSKQLSKKGYSGLEFAGGIPGTLGGAVYMNAGAHLSSMCSIIEDVVVLDCDSNIVKLSNEECNFSYRKSIFQKSDYIILEAKIKLDIKDKAQVFKKMAGNFEYRNVMQPLDLPSCGSTFRNPDGMHAGQLIEECGLKGYQIGGAQVSEKHANFIVNIDNATTEDVLELCDYIIKVVYDKKGITLTPEMEVLKDNDER